MGSENEPAKLLLPYLQRADELQKHELLVAYYCRLYAMERGLKIPPKERTKTTNSILVSLMNQLEKDKKSLQLGPDDHLYVEGFASNVFAKADKQDRAGRADMYDKTFHHNLNFSVKEVHCLWCSLGVARLTYTGYDYMESTWRGMSL